MEKNEKMKKKLKTNQFGICPPSPPAGEGRLSFFFLGGGRGPSQTRNLGGILSLTACSVAFSVLQSSETRFRDERTGLWVVRGDSM